MSRQLIADIYAPRERASATVQGGTSSHGQPRRSPLANPVLGDTVPARSLAEQQRLFAAAVMTPEHAPSYLDEAAAASLLTTGPTLSALERLEIYRSGYHARLVECLQDDYPALQHALGEAKFVELCHRYIARHPSDGPSLNVYGRHMAAFCLAPESTANEGIAAESESGASQAQFHSELAALEWAIVQTIHAPSGTSLRPEDLALIPAEAWPEVKLVLNPSLTVLQSSFAINSYFQAFRNGGTALVPTEEPSVLAIYRTGRSVWRLPLSAAMGHLLADLKRGTPLAVATEAVTAQLTESSEAEAANTVTRWFASAVSSGLFGGVTY